jgi:phospholipid/cholesterol/gamma-HCH transport system substrate-binding protein
MKRNTIWIIAAIIVIGGWYLIKNYTQLLSKTIIYYGYFDNVRGLQGSSPIYLKGVKVGKVDDIDLSIHKRVKVAFAIDKNLQLPQGTVAIISSGDVNGSKSIRLELGTDKQIIPAEGKLATNFDSSMVESFHAKITPMLHNGKVLLKSTDTALRDFNTLIIGGLGHQTQQGIKRFYRVTENTTRTSGNAIQKVGEFNQSITNIENKTETLAGKGDNLDKNIQNIEAKSGKAVEKTKLSDDLNDLGKSINQFSATIKSMRSNKAFTDTVTYRNTSRSVDTFNRSIKGYSEDPPPLIQIFDFGKKKK